jgi:hypothetical protein
MTEAGVSYGGGLNNWQATVTPFGDAYIVPTYHPSYLMRGYQHLQSSQMFAIKRAMEIASFGRSPLDPDLVIDPPIQFMHDWIKSIHPESWLSVDIETAHKQGVEEDDLDFVHTSQIIRINFASTVEQGITVPWNNQYLPVIREAVSLPNPKVFWNARFDVPILAAHDTPVSGTILDFMLGWHVLQSRLPKGLGFVTPFYADIGPWKHLSGEQFEKYSAIDPVAALACANGIAKDLSNAGQWDAFINHIVNLDQQVLFPAEAEGLLLDTDLIKGLSANIQVQLKLFNAELQSAIPRSLLPLAGGWKREPSKKYPGAFRKKVTERVYVCTDCGEEDVTAKHKCQ